MTVFKHEGVRNFLLGLTTEDRRNYFCSTLSDGAVSYYVDGVNFVHYTTLGAVVLSGSGRCLRYGGLRRSRAAGT